MRRRTTVKEMKVDPLTSVAGLRKWTDALIAECCRASNRSKVRTTTYARSSFLTDCIESVEGIPKKWDLFDTELCAALLRSVTGGVERALQLYQERNARNGVPTSGRAVLFTILRRFELDYGQAMRVHISALNALRYNGELEVFLDALDARLALMISEPDESLLLAIVEPELRKVTDLAYEFAVFDRAPDGSPAKTLSFLYDAARRACARERQRKTVDSLTPATKQVKQVKQLKPKAEAKAEPKPKGLNDVGAKNVGVHPQVACGFWRTGACKFGDKC